LQEVWSEKDKFQWKLLDLVDHEAALSRLRKHEKKGNPEYVISHGVLAWEERRDGDHASSLWGKNTASFFALKRTNHSSLTKSRWGGNHEYESLQTDGPSSTTENLACQHGRPSRRCNRRQPSEN
jgi:hypothetical protein